MEKEIAFIKKNGSQWCVYSKEGKNLGCYDTEDGAKKRLQQVEFFKHEKGTVLSNGQFTAKESALFKKVVAKTSPVSKEEIRAILEKNMINEDDSEDEEEEDKEAGKK